MLTIKIARQTEKFIIYSLTVADGTFNSTSHERLETLLQIMEMHDWTAYYQLSENAKCRLAMSNIQFVHSH